MNINNYNSTTFTSRSKVNYLRIPTNVFGFNDQGVTEFNEIVKYWESQYSTWTPIKRTASGGICTRKGVLRYPAWDFLVENAYVELTVLTGACCARYQVSINQHAIGDVGKKIGGGQAFRTFMSVCTRHNIDLKKYAIENGEEVKKTIEKPMIQCYRRKLLYQELEHVHHIDLNSSYMSGIAKAFPELEPAIREIYEKRKDPAHNKEYKAVLNCSYGYFQSKYCRIGGHGYALSHLSRAARQFNDAYINDLIERLRAAHRNVLMINTDGIWYQGDIFHDVDEGTDLCQWKNDHTNCKFRMKSDGAYEFIENGQYYPVVRGSTRLDQILDRSEWKWGDIFQYDASISSVFQFDVKTHQFIKSEVMQ